MKNQESAASRALRAMLFDSCLLLTGTPLQNNMTELWTLMSIVDPAVFSDLDDFLEKFEGMGVDAVRVWSLVCAMATGACLLTSPPFASPVPPDCPQ